MPLQNGKVGYAMSVDVRSLFIMAEEIENKTGRLVVAVVRRFFLLFGAPRILQADNGPEFQQELAVLCQEFNVMLIHSSPHHPQSQGIFLHVMPHFV